MNKREELFNEIERLATRINNLRGVVQNDLHDHIDDEDVQSVVNDNLLISIGLSESLKDWAKDVKKFYCEKAKTKEN